MHISKRPVTQRIRTTGLVACCASKLPGAHPAGELYQSDLFKKSVAYLQTLCDDWYILSAKHGLLHPATVIRNYDLTLRNFSAADKAVWNRMVRQQISSLPQCNLIVLAGRDYCGWIDGHPITRPLEGLRIGEQLQYLKHVLRTTRPTLT